MTTSKILGITAETPRGEDDTQARYRWTKFTLATHIRVDPNKPALKEFCQAAPSVWDGNVAYFIKEKAKNLKCGKHLSNIRCVKYIKFTQVKNIISVGTRIQYQL